MSYRTRLHVVTVITGGYICVTGSLVLPILLLCMCVCLYVYIIITKRVHSLAAILFAIVLPTKHHKEKRSLRPLSITSVCCY